MNLDGRSFIDPQSLIVVEITLFDAAILDGDFAIEDGRQSENDSPSIWALMVSGLIIRPQSTAHTMRCTLT